MAHQYDRTKHYILTDVELDACTFRKEVHQSLNWARHTKSTRTNPKNIGALLLTRAKRTSCHTNYNNHERRSKGLQI